jgi:hypothetical protein
MAATNLSALLNTEPEDVEKLQAGRLFTCSYGFELV